jgi:maltose O-acetyltransferase
MRNFCIIGLVSNLPGGKTMTDKEIMLNGDLYFSGCKELDDMRNSTEKIMAEFNSDITDHAKRDKIIHQLFNKCGQNVFFRGELQVDYGCNISVGDNFFANFGTILLDVNEIIIGSGCMFGPRVGIYTAGHPTPYQERNSGLEFGLKVVIGDNCWIGGNVVINPGVTIGSGSVIGSGAIVTRDIPADSIAVGNPCKVLRKITEEDRKFWQEKINKYKDEI